jgi:hypothetical protein
VASANSAVAAPIAPSPHNLMSRVSCIMRHSPAASEATTVSGATATPSVRPQRAPRGHATKVSATSRSQRERSSIARSSAFANRDQRSEMQLQAPLSFGRRPAARPAVCEDAGLAAIGRPPARAGRARTNGFGVRSERRSGLSRSGPHGLAIGQLIFGHWRIPGRDIERPFG